MQFIWRLILLSGIVVPTATMFLFAGIMMGKPKPCEIKAPCKQSYYGIETLTLAVIPLIPAVSMALFMSSIRSKTE